MDIPSYIVTFFELVILPISISINSASKNKYWPLKKGPNKDQIFFIKKNLLMT